MQLEVKSMHGSYRVVTGLEGINSYIKCLIQKHYEVLMRTFHAQKDLKKKSASMFFWFSMLVHKTTDKTNFIDHQVISFVCCWWRQQSHCWTPFTDGTSKIDWDSLTCIMYTTDYYQLLILESWFTNLEETPLNRSQQLPAPYKRLIYEIKQN